MIEVFSTTACPVKIAHLVGKAVQNGNLPLVAADTLRLPLSLASFLTDLFAHPNGNSGSVAGKQNWKRALSFLP